jgi:glycosidase
MPDLNLDSQAVRDEIVSIMKFWLNRGVDGFRLDAVTSYYTCEDARNVEFLSWLNREAKKIKEDCYIVGEAWTGDNVIRNYYSSGIDSFFHFSLSQAEGTLASIVRNSNPHVLFRTAVNNSISLTNGHIPAIFLDNHDTNRITGAIGRSKIERLKFVYGYTGMLNGCIYTYYGTEIGMEGGHDPDCRRCMPWDEIDAGVYDEEINEIRKLISLRKEHPAARSRNFHFPNSIDDKRTVEYIKICDKGCISIVLNCGDEPIDLPPEITYKNVLYSRKYSSGVLDAKGILISLLQG